MRLLFVEHLFNRTVFFIERFGYYTIDIAETSYKAIEYLKEKKYDIIFLGGELSAGSYGSDVAEWLVKNLDNENSSSSVFIHTWNFVEIELIMRLLPYAWFVPFDEVAYNALNI